VLDHPEKRQQEEYRSLDDTAVHPDEEEDLDVMRLPLGRQNKLGKWTAEQGLTVEAFLSPMPGQ
jgi:hypothetical protein